jgi:hypothetical protein
MSLQVQHRDGCALQCKRRRSRTAAFIVSAIDRLDPEYGFTAFGPIGGVFVIGVGMPALGVPLMIACAVRFRAFFRGETPNEDTPILVPDTGAEPAALHE